MAFGAVSTARSTYEPTSTYINQQLQAALNLYFKNKIPELFGAAERLLKTAANAPIYTYPSTAFGVIKTVSNAVLQSSGYVLYGGITYWYADGGYIPSQFITRLASQADLEGAFGPQTVSAGVGTYVEYWLKNNVLSSDNRPSVSQAKEYVYAYAYQRHKVVQTFLPAPATLWANLPK